MKPSYRNLTADQWYKKTVENLQEFPFGFTYDGTEYKGFSSSFFFEEDRQTVTQNEKETQTITGLFAKQLRITLIVTHYYSHGATEWTVWFENISDQNSAVLEALKTEWTFDGAQPILKGILGDHVNQYRPYCQELCGSTVTFSSDSGRATHINFPYFNLEYGNGGAMLSIGWAGTWKAVFRSDGTHTVCTASSVNNAKLYLKPGEKIRTALFTVAPYTVRNEHYATNYWRDWYVQYNLPKADAQGNALQPFSTCCFASDTGRVNSDGSISEGYDTWRPTFEKMFAENAKTDFRWVDAGWYQAPDLGSAVPHDPERDWWQTVGTWVLDPKKWPEKTFLESTEFARANGMKTLMWFEPERVTSPDELVKHFGYKRAWAIEQEGVKAISNNIGDAECLKWTTDRICKLLRENKVEMYREDNNCNPAQLWNYMDAKEGENRRGITEYKFIQAHYQMWDDIIACTLSYGGCGFVDSCASGGGRNDLESMRRGVPLLRSDSDRTSTALRLSMTTAFNKWIPFCGANTKEKQHSLAPTGVSDPYVWRASYLPVLNVDSQFVQDPNQNFDVLRFGLQEWKKVTPYLLKDFYTLTPWHTEKDNTDFTVYCYYDPETEKGVLFAFAQERCERNTLTVQLPFAENGGTYQLEDEDGKAVCETDGSITLSFAQARTARLLWVRRV